MLLSLETKRLLRVIDEKFCGYSNPKFCTVILMVFEFGGKTLFPSSLHPKHSQMSGRYCVLVLSRLESRTTYLGKFLPEL